jgi:hypothetical protein
MAKLPKLDMNGIAYTFKLIPKAAQRLFPDYLTCHNLLSEFPNLLFLGCYMDFGIRIKEAYDKWLMQFFSILGFVYCEKLETVVKLDY